MQIVYCILFIFRFLIQWKSNLYKQIPCRVILCGGKFPTIKAENIHHGFVHVERRYCAYAPYIYVLSFFEQWTCFYIFKRIFLKLYFMPWFVSTLNMWLYIIQYEDITIFHCTHSMWVCSICAASYDQIRSAKLHTKRHHLFKQRCRVVFDPNATIAHTPTLTSIVGTSESLMTDDNTVN